MKSLLIAGLIVATLSGCASMGKSAYSGQAAYAENEFVSTDLSSMKYLHSLGDESATVQRPQVSASTLAAVSIQRNDYSRSNDADTDAQSDYDQQFDDDQSEYN